MGHSYWGMHMVWGLKAPLRFVSSLAVDFSLGRVWARDTGANTCRALKPTCKGAACTEADVLPRPWHAEQFVAPVIDGPPKPGSPVPGRKPLRLGASGEYLPMPKQPGVKFRFGAEQTRNSCGEGTFTCHSASQMCKEEATTWEPMDTTPMRAMWINCTATLCPRLRMDKYSPRCAGSMLAAWTALWRHSPVSSNTSLAIELRDAGATEGAAIGWQDPAHASAALSALTRQAHEMVSGKEHGSGAPPAQVKEVVQQCVQTLRTVGIAGVMDGRKRYG